MAQNLITYSCGHKAPEPTSMFSKVKRALSNKEQPKDIPIKVPCERCRRELATEQLNASLVEIEIEDAIEKGRKASQIEKVADGKAHDNSWFDKKAEEQKIEIDFWRDRMDKLANRELLARNRAEGVFED